MSICAISGWLNKWKALTMSSNRVRPPQVFRNLIRAEGFTLIEVLVATGLIVVGILGISLNTIGVIQGNYISSNITIATNLTQDKLEETRNMAYAAITSGSDSGQLTETGETGGTGAIYTRSWTTASGPTAGTKQVTVTVTWTDQTSHQVQLQTIVVQ